MDLVFTRDNGKYLLMYEIDSNKGNESYVAH